jgi:hypothetical protein
LRDTGLLRGSFVSTLFLMPIVAILVGDRYRQQAIFKSVFGVEWIWELCR